jgi:arylsulfatase A-like enzyme
MDVHWPYHLEAELELPAEISQAWIDVKHLYRVNWKNDSISPDQEAHYLHLYQEAVRYTDAQIGRLLSRLDEIGLLKNTAIIVVSDHGEEMLERGKWGHFEVNLHDEILRVPLIIRLPDERATGIIRQQVRTMDIMPTVLELCGCPEPAGMAGRSLAPLWQGIPGHDEDRLSISEMWRDARHIIAVRTEEHKYIWDSRSPEAGELYDLNADPGERINIVHREPELKMRYQGEVDEHLLKVAATNPAVPVEAPELDAAMVRRLRDLGYLE